MRLASIGLVLFASFLLLEGCTGADQVSAEAGAPVTAPGPSSSPPIFPGTNNVNGLVGAHFDVDTSRTVYAPNSGLTTHHVHRYDKIYQTTIVDLFNILDPAFDSIPTTLKSGQRFCILVVNSQLSQGAVFEINGTVFPATDLQKMGLCPVIYETGAPTVQADQQLSSLKIGFSPQVNEVNGLLLTEPPCVIGNQSGKIGEYRDGSLVIQLVPPSTALDSTTGAAVVGATIYMELMVYLHGELPTGNPPPPKNSNPNPCCYSSGQSSSCVASP